MNLFSDRVPDTEIGKWILLCLEGFVVLSMLAVTTPILFFFGRSKEEAESEMTVEDLVDIYDGHDVLIERSEWDWRKHDRNL